MLKKKIFEALMDLVEDKAMRARNAMQALEMAKANETKSAMGDKFETARAMINSEYEQAQTQLYESQKTMELMQSLDLSLHCDQIKKGSLISTNRGNFFIIASLGKLSIEGEEFFALSAESPLGRFLTGKKKGDKAIFMGNEFEILRIE